MSDANEVQDGLPGWLISAARAATALGFRELGSEASVATAWLQRIERMPAIALRQTRGRGAEGIEPESMARLLGVFRRHGLELRAAGAGWPAVLVCNDPAALEAVRSANGKGDAGGDK